MAYKAKIHITLKEGVLDPQGKAISNVLGSLGFDGISEMRQGKYIEFSLDEKDHLSAKNKADAICKKLLANTVIENYHIKIEE
ncbi:MAG: phosphoribosylformylglycinamidine synthase [Rhodospirillaceae bacterium]|nr:phosphoribosylformylglycinamidine synthase [Rhodospirillaceae bacterium]|tara:strand:- start:896 stop:1144 length:249 start_codon:yes stop_codon:yes gene_type:complete